MDSALKHLTSYVENWVDLDKLKSLILEHKIASAVVGSATLYGLWFLKRPRNLPPGPYGYPLIGSFPIVLGDFSAALNTLSQKYGDVVCLWLGGYNYVVNLNSYDAIKELYIGRGTDFADRIPGQTVPGVETSDGIFVCPYDDTYKASRKIAMGTIRNFLSSKIEDIMQQEMERVHEYILENGESAELDIHIPITNSFANMLLETLYCRSFPYNSHEVNQYITTINQLIESAVGGFPVMLMPSPVGQWLFKKTLNTAVEKYEAAVKNVDRFISQCESNPIAADRSKLCVAEAYLDAKFDRALIPQTITALSVDLIHTAGCMCQWTFAYLLNYPKYQEVILKEIRDLKWDTPVSPADRKNMPITESFIMEVFRKVTPVPLSFFVFPVKNTTFRGYNMPSYVKIMANISAVHNDPKLFPEPELFRPERFLKDGKIGNTEGFMPFGTGRRMCVGESISRTTIFLFLSNVIQRYQIEASPEGPPSLIPAAHEAILQPQPFKLFLKNRK